MCGTMRTRLWVSNSSSVWSTLPKPLISISKRARSAISDLAEPARALVIGGAPDGKVLEVNDRVEDVGDGAVDVLAEGKGWHGVQEGSFSASQMKCSRGTAASTPEAKLFTGSLRSAASFSSTCRPKSLRLRSSASSWSGSYGFGTRLSDSPPIEQA